MILEAIILAQLTWPPPASTIMPQASQEIPGGVINSAMPFPKCPEGWTLVLLPANNLATAKCAHELRDPE